MSPIGRIFSVVNLILAALFLSWASNTLATSNEFKEQFTSEQAAHEQTKTDLNGQISRLRGEVEQARAECAQFREERDQAQLTADRNAADVQAAGSQNSELRSSYDKISNSFGSLESELRNLQDAKDRAFQAQVDAEKARDGALTDKQAAASVAANLQSENEALQKKIEDLQAEISGLNGQLSSLDTQLKTLVDMTGASLSDIVPQPLIEGTVVQALYDVEPGLVSINAGANMGVQRGFTFEIYNGSSYKGQVRVENVRDNMCTAIVKSQVPGQTIRQGDSAATRL